MQYFSIKFTRKTKNCIIVISVFLFLASSMQFVLAVADDGFDGSPIAENEETRKESTGQPLAQESEDDFFEHPWDDLSEEEKEKQEEEQRKYYQQLFDEHVKPYYWVMKEGVFLRVNGKKIPLKPGTFLMILDEKPSDSMRVAVVKFGEIQSKGLVDQKDLVQLGAVWERFQGQLPPDGSKAWEYNTFAEAALTLRFIFSDARRELEALASEASFKAIAIEPENPEFYFYKISAYYTHSSDPNSNSSKICMEAMNKLLELRPDTPVALYFRGLRKEENGDFEGAKSDYLAAKKILETAPKKEMTVKDFLKRINETLDHLKTKHPKNN